jgi:hypothetical protein
MSLVSSCFGVYHIYLIIREYSDRLLGHANLVSKSIVAR